MLSQPRDQLGTTACGYEICFLEPQTQNFCGKSRNVRVFLDGRSAACRSPRRHGVWKA